MTLCARSVKKNFLNLRFVEQVELIINNAYRMLGFIYRIAEEFNNVETIIYLYSSLVSPILNYTSPIWTHVKYSIQTCEHVAHKFLKFLESLRVKYHSMNLIVNIRHCIQNLDSIV